MENVAAVLGDFIGGVTLTGSDWAEGCRRWGYYIPLEIYFLFMFI